MNRRNATVLTLAFVLMGIAFVGIFFVAQVVNPPAVPVVVARADIPAGTVLTEDLLGVDRVRLGRPVLAAQIKESELAGFIGGVVVEPIHAYSLVPKASITIDGNPASANRLALTLADPTLVAMVVPVNDETAPPAIVAGDVVDLVFGVGNPGSIDRLTTAPTPTPESLVVGYAPAEPTPEPAGEGRAEPTATEEPRYSLPVAKNIVYGARVLAVVREQTRIQGESLSEPSTGVTAKAAPGPIVGLVLAIPREAQEVVQFAVINGEIRVALVSPNAEAAVVREPTLGMTWDDLVALVRMERDAALATAAPQTVLGPGAFAVESTRAALGATAQGLTATAATAGATPVATAGPAGATPAPSTTPGATP